jgi:hypothetical protein
MQVVTLNVPEILFVSNLDSGVIGFVNRGLQANENGNK